MQHRPKSERLFEEFCKSRSVEPVALKCNGKKQPDYELFFDGQKVVFEIKQVEANAADRRYNATLKSGKMAAQTRDPDAVAERVRNLIERAADQIKSYHRENADIPAVVVVYDNANNSYTDIYAIQTAMHGWEQVTLSVPSNGQPPTVVDRGFGRRNNKTFRPDKNTHISAVATLHEFWDMATKERQLGLRFYHNCYATNPFNRAWWDDKNISHLILTDKVEGEFQNWKPLTS